MNTPAYWNPSHFAVGQAVMCNGFRGTIVRHYHEGMWEVRVPGGVCCTSGHHLVAI